MDSVGRSVNQEMDDAQGTYNYEDEGKLFGMGVDVAVIESNGHGVGRKGESMNLVETIKIFQNDVQSYIDDNEKLMIDKEQQKIFNIKILHILDIIDLRRWIRRLSRENQGVTSPMIRGEELEVLVGITITPQGIQLGEYVIVQVHPLSGRIRIILGWMSYREK